LKLLAGDIVWLLTPSLVSEPTIQNFALPLKEISAISAFSLV